MPAKCFTVATRSSGVLAVVGAMSFGRPVPMDRPLIFDGLDGAGLPALDTIHRIDRTRLAFELSMGARLSDACGRDSAAKAELRR